MLIIWRYLQEIEEIIAYEIFHTVLIFQFKFLELRELLWIFKQTVENDFTNAGGSSENSQFCDQTNPYCLLHDINKLQLKTPLGQSTQTKHLKKLRHQKNKKHLVLYQL